MNTAQLSLNTSNNQRLKGMLLTPDIHKDNYPAVLFIHGWLSDMKGYVPRATAIANIGYICLIFDLRGHGGSDGKLGDVTAAGSLVDAIAAYDYLASLPEVDKDRIGVVGSSYGGYIATLLTEKRPVSALALRVPAIYRNETFTKPKVQEMRNDLTAYRQSAIHTKDNYALRALANYTRPVLLIESEKDEQIPHQTIENYRHAINPKSDVIDILMQGADHSLRRPEWKQKFIDILVDWFTP
jgi:dipeptidyl aminopeptidase/acylaminoacyl peptidase